MFNPKLNYRTDTPFCIEKVDFMSVNRHLEKYYLSGWHESQYRKAAKFEDQDGYQCSIYDYVVKQQALGLLHACVEKCISYMRK